MKPGRLAGIVLLAAVAAGGLSACMLPPDAPTVRASAGGTGPDDAYIVASEAQEREILRLLGLNTWSKRLHVIDGKPFNVLTANNPQTEETRDVWFDISRFFRRQ